MILSDLEYLNLKHQHISEWSELESGLIISVQLVNLFFDDINGLHSCALKHEQIFLIHTGSVV